MLFILVFSILFLKPSSGIINCKGPTVIKEFLNCMSSLIDHNFQKPGLVVFGKSGNSSTFVVKLREQILKNIHGKNQFVVQIVTPDYTTICGLPKSHKGNVFNFNMEEYKPVPIANYFIIIADGAEDFFHFGCTIVRSRYWNPYAKFIVLLSRATKSASINRREIQDILRYLYSYNVINVVVCAAKNDKMRSLFIYGWRPYDPPKYCGYDNDTYENRLIVENVCEHGIIKYRKGVFENRLPNNMHGCNMKFLALERQPFVSRSNNDPNIEKIMVNELLQKFNFTVEYQIINAFRGERNKTGKWDGALKELVARKGQALLGGIFPDFDVHEDFECSLTYLSDSYAWVVPRAYPSPPWIALTITFHRYVWYFTVAAFFICVFAWKVFGHISCDTQYNKSLMHCFMNVWTSSLGFSSYMRPVQESLRVFYVFLNIYCILLITAYTTKLIEVLLNPTFENQIHTVEELIQSKLRFGGSEELLDLFYNSSDPFDYMIGEKWIHVNNISKALIDVVVNRNFSVLCSRLELAYLSAIIPELTDDLGRDNYYVFKMNTFTVPIEMIALKGFPFMKNISRTLSIYKQLGLNSMLRQYFTTLNMKKRAKQLKKIKNHNNFKALSIKHLQGGFLALAIGAVGGTVVLILEIISDLHFIKSEIKSIRSKRRMK